MTLPHHVATGLETVTEWKDGWLCRARRVVSPNFGPRPSPVCIDLIVVHSISLPPGVFGGNAIEQLFTNQLDWNAHPYYKTIAGMEVSAHFLIRRNGELLQFVGCDERAWHAGISSWRGRNNCNDDSVGIELEGIEGGFFEPEQYTSLAQLCHSLRHQYPIAHVAGHEHIAPGRKTDPGAGFDWPHFRQQLASCIPALQFPTPPEAPPHQSR